MINDPFSFDPFNDNMFDRVGKQMFNRFGFNQTELLDIYMECMQKIMKTEIDRLNDEIDKMMKSTYNPFSVLGVKQNLTENDLKNAYRNKAREHHPDKGGKEEDFKKIQVAYEVIKKMRGWK